MKEGVLAQYNLIKKTDIEVSVNFEKENVNKCENNDNYNNIYKNNNLFQKSDKSIKSDKSDKSDKDKIKIKTFDNNENNIKQNMNNIDITFNENPNNS